ncbi:MAG: GDSL-type esterase/lipase family protein [Verrucomicrobiae bacterium]|nr:GDSL-type esterase/lipase family protein [Verrucomicrobiae bacterium]
MNVLFLGDSLTKNWDPELWHRRLAPLGAVNWGVNGQNTPQLLRRIQRGLLDNLAPRAIVLMIGINDVWPGYSPAVTARNIEAIVATIRQRSPLTKILLIGLLPAFDKHDPVRDWIRSVNARIARLADGDSVSFLDIGALLLEEDGSLKPGYYSVDQVHLLRPAYQILTDALEPLLRELLDNATNDPSTAG